MNRASNHRSSETKTRHRASYAQISSEKQGKSSKRTPRTIDALKGFAGKLATRRELQAALKELSPVEILLELTKKKYG